MQHPEKQLQIALNNAWSREGRFMYFAYFNNPRNKIQGQQNKLMGVRAGISDIIIPAPGSIFIELKSLKGKQQPNQKSFEAECLEYGMVYILGRDFDQIREEVKNHCTWGYE